MLWSSQEGQCGGGWAAGHGAESAVIPRGAATSTLHHYHVTLTGPTLVIPSTLQMALRMLDVLRSLGDEFSGPLNVNKPWGS